MTPFGGARTQADTRREGSGWNRATAGLQKLRTDVCALIVFILNQKGLASWIR